MELYWITTWIVVGVGVSRSLSSAGLSVAENPAVTGDHAA